MLSVEAAASFGWAEWSQAQVALDHYGDSAPASDLRKEYGFEPEDVAAAAEALLEKTT